VFHHPNSVAIRYNDNGDVSLFVADDQGIHVIDHLGSKLALLGGFKWFLMNE
jgi:hypothetical protein